MAAEGLAEQRLASQRLAGNPLESAEAVVGWMGAMQAQEYPYAKWSIGQRAADLTSADIDRLLADGRILRTHMLRPTWHFVLPADIRWMMSLTAPRVNVANRHWLRVAGLDEATLERAKDAIVGALAGRRLTRRQIQQELAAAGIEAAGQRLAYILMQAELDMLICSGGLAGKQHTYALLDELAAAANPYSPDEALAEFTRRYFTSHGPATIADFCWWSSLTVADARRGLAMVGTELEETSIDGVSYWAAGEPASAGSGVRSGAGSGSQPDVKLMYGLDELVVGYQKTRAVIDRAGYATGLAAGAVDVSFYHAILIDDQVTGLWHRVIANGGATIETRRFRDFTPDESKALEAEVARFGRFFGVPARVDN